MFCHCPCMLWPDHIRRIHRYNKVPERIHPLLTRSRNSFCSIIKSAQGLLNWPPKPKLVYLLPHEVSLRKRVASSRERQCHLLRKHDLQNQLFSGNKRPGAKQIGAVFICLSVFCCAFLWTVVYEAIRARQLYRSYPRHLSLYTFCKELIQL